MRYLLVLLVAFGLVLTAPRPSIAQESTPAAASELMQIADDTYAFVSSGYISLFVVTSAGVIATDPANLVDPTRIDRYVAAIASVTDQPVRYVIYSHADADHATGGAVFTDATFVSHRNAVAQLAARNDPNTPVPTLAFDDFLSLTLGETTVELYYTGRNHSDNSIVLLNPQSRVLFAVDFIPVDSLPYQNLPEAYPEEWIASLQWIEDNFDFDTLVPGHPPIPGTKANVTEVRTYLQDLIAAVQAAQAQGLADNSPEMIASVSAALEPAYGTWTNFTEWLPLNIEGLIRIWSEQPATPTT